MRLERVGADDEVALAHVETLLDDRRGDEQVARAGAVLLEHGRLRAPVEADADRVALIADAVADADGRLEPLEPGRRPQERGEDVGRVAPLDEDDAAERGHVLEAPQHVDERRVLGRHIDVLAAEPRRAKVV